MTPNKNIPYVTVSKAMKVFDRMEWYDLIAWRIGETVSPAIPKA